MQTTFACVMGSPLNPRTMAIYHLSVKTISRSDGRSATAAAAYRSGERIADLRTGDIHDYSRKGGVESCTLILPSSAPVWAKDRRVLWNAAEQAETRKNSTVAREFEIALPEELGAEQRKALAHELARAICERHGCAVDVAIHRPGGKGDTRNHHAHLLLTTRRLGENGFTEKTRELDDKKTKQVECWREQFAVLQNNYLDRAGSSSRVSHESLEAQGIDRIAQVHIGPKVLEMEARGIRTERGNRASEIAEQNAKIMQLDDHRKALHGRIKQAQESTQRGRTGLSVRAVGSSHDYTDGRDPQGLGPDAGDGAQVHHGMGAGAAQRVGGVANGSARDASRRPGDAGDFGADTRSEGGFTEHDASVDELGSRHSSALHRILSLSGTQAYSESESRSRSQGDRSRNETQQEQKIDRTYLAVRRQLSAMGCAVFDVGVLDKAGRMLIRTCEKAKVLASVAWLKRENAKGSEIYIRPGKHQDKNSGLILVDDLKRSQIELMKLDGMTPAAVTETSPANYQAWVRVGDTPIGSAAATEIAQALAQRYEGDAHSADWRHFGRLAGFTNNKPQHLDPNGRAPYVLCHESSGKVATAAEPMLAEIQTKEAEKAHILEQEQRAAAKITRLNRIQGGSGHLTGRDSTSTYLAYSKSMLSGPDALRDLSVMDFRVTVRMLKTQLHSREAIGNAMREVSPELATRKAGHIEDYIERTLKAAERRIEEERLELNKRYSAKTKDKDRDHGMSL